MAVTMRNYKRHLGVLLSTRFDIRELEMGVYEKEYDQTTGDYYLERKIIKLNPTGFIDVQWIQERTKVEEIVREEAEVIIDESSNGQEDSGIIDNEHMP